MFALRRALWPWQRGTLPTDVLANSRSAGTSPWVRSVDFASNEPSVRCQDDVGLGGSRHFAQFSTARVQPSEIEGFISSWPQVTRGFPA
jgi:hypothetical protein